MWKRSPVIVKWNTFSKSSYGERTPSVKNAKVLPKAPTNLVVCFACRKAALYDIINQELFVSEL